MSTILLNFGVHTRNWPRIDLQPLVFNFEFYFWRFRGPRFAEFQQSQNRRSLYQAQNLKKSFKIIILTEVKFILQKKPTKTH